MNGPAWPLKLTVTGPSVGIDRRGVARLSLTGRRAQSADTVRDERSRLSPIWITHYRRRQMSGVLRDRAVDGQGHCVTARGRCTVMATMARVPMSCPGSFCRVTGQR